MAKLDDVANCFLQLDADHGGEGLTNLKLQKLVYYAQGFYSAMNDKPLFNDDIEAWMHGPVVAHLYRQYKSYGSSSIPAPAEFDMNCLTLEEQELLQEVFDVFGQFSAWKLRDMTHEEPPWIKHEKNAEVIPLPEITEYFKTRVH
jgi:uncharacterized phage-associated protein